MRGLSISGLIVAAFAVSGSVAFAADMPAKAPRYVAAPTWAGWYVGLNAGYGWGRERREDVLPPVGGFWTPGVGFGDTLNPKDGVYGGQVGYNFQTGAWVFGLEANIEGANLREDKASIFFPATDSWHSKVLAIITATGRVGYAMNAWLPYVRGGYATAKLKSRMDDNTPAANYLENNSWYNGWVIGGGVEYMLTSNWILGAEYNYMNFGSRTWTGVTTSAAGVPQSNENFREKLSISTVTARLSYKF
jgi:outer membrane immunogenic protein